MPGAAGTASGAPRCSAQSRCEPVVPNLTHLGAASALQTQFQPTQPGPGQTLSSGRSAALDHNCNCSVHLWGWSSLLGQCLLLSLCPLPSLASAGRGQVARAGCTVRMGSHRIPPTSLVLALSFGKSGCSHWPEGCRNRGG